MEYTNTTKEQRGSGMAFDAKEYNKNYKKEHKDLVNFRVPKGGKQKLADMASRQGKGLARFIRDALYYYMDALEVDRIDLG